MLGDNFINTISISVIEEKNGRNPRGNILSEPCILKQFIENDYVRKFVQLEEYKMTIQKDSKDKISGLKSNDFFSGVVKILRKAKPGPVILQVSDGVCTIDAVSKECEFETGDVIKLSGFVNERAGRMQIEIKSVFKSDKNFDDILEENSKPKRQELSMQSDKLEKLKPYFLKIAARIRRSIFDGQPIMIRHHADADGITSALCIEKACVSLMTEIGMESHYNFFRSPSKAPFYEVMDVLKDITFSTKFIAGHGQKKPLILILDNGSTPEDVFAMKICKDLGYEVIVIDHHNPVEYEGNKTAVCPYVSLHVNPYMEGFDGQVTAGMECYETPRFANETFDNKVLPALSAIGDRSDIDEAHAYIKNSGVPEEELRDMVIALDYLAYNLRHDSGKGVYEEVLDNKAFVKTLISQVNKGVETQLQSTLPYLRTQTIGGVCFSYIDLAKYTLRFTYPTPGKLIGIIHDQVKTGKEAQPVLSLGILPDMIIFRATEPVLPVQEVIDRLQKEVPEANVDGGGHECAGTIKFVEAHKDYVFESIKRMLREKREAQMKLEE